MSAAPLSPLTAADLTMLESMINLTGSNNREDSFTFLLSQQHNNSGTLEEMYQIARGCTISFLTINVLERALVTVDSRWIATSISDWSTSHGLTTPTFASALTGTPWSAIDTGENPLVFIDIEGGDEYDIRRFSARINHNVFKRQIFDQNHTFRVDPTIRDIAIEIDGVYKDDAISESVKTFEPQEIKMHLNLNADTLIALTLTFTDVFLEKYDEAADAQNTRAKVVRYTGTASSVLIGLETTAALVSATSKHKYDIAGVFPVAQSSIHKYDVVGVILVAQTSTQKYNIGKLVTATTIHKYDIQTSAVLGNFDDDNFVSANFILDS